jgi:hypothetical protein
LSILAYCLSVDRKTFFVLEQGREPFEDAVRSLTARGFFKQGPFVTHGYSYDITDDCWALLQDFKWGILNRAEASYPDLKQKIEFYHAYQIKYGFWQTTIPAAELAKIISVFRKK